MKKTITKLKLALLGLFTFTLVGCHDHTPEEKAKKITGWISEELELNSEQSSKVAKIFNELLQLRKEFKSQRENRLNTLLTNLKSDSINQDEVLTLYEVHRGMLDAKVKSVVGKWAELHASLSSKQRKELSEKVEKKLRYFN